MRADAEDLGPGGQLEPLVTGDRSPDDHPVVVRVDRVHLSGLEEVLDEELLPEVHGGAVSTLDGDVEYRTWIT